VEAGTVKATRKSVNEAFPIQSTFILRSGCGLVQNMPTKWYYAIVNLLNIGSLEVVLTGVNEYLPNIPHLLPDLGGIRCVICAYNVECT
jgi:hypothetical protein